MIIKIAIVVETEDSLHRVLNFEEHFVTWMLEKLDIPRDDIDVGIVVNKTKNKMIRFISIRNRSYDFSISTRKLYKESGIKKVTITEYSEEGDRLQ